MPDTPCKDCCFAEYDGLTQTDCKLNRIEKFRECGTEILEAYDNDKEFYVIKNRICRFKRNYEWWEKFKNQKYESVLYSESTVKFHAIILLKDKSCDELRITVDSMIKESYKPAKITVVRQPNSKIQPGELTDVFAESPTIWTVQNLIFKQSHGKAIHHANKHVPAHYYAVIDAGKTFSPNLLADINHAVNYELIQFGMIEDENTCVIPLGVHNHWYVEGNPKETIPENIREYQCQNPKQKIVYKMDEIRNLIPSS